MRVFVAKSRILKLAILGVLVSSCQQGADEQSLKDKARLEADQTAQVETENAYERGKREAEAQLQTQLDNIEKVKKRAWEEGHAAATAQVDAENGNLAQKAADMEADLATRQLFFQAAKGTYEGTLKTEKGTFMIRISLTPSLAPYPVSRVRALDEITSDLTNLYFNAQILQWNASNPLSAVGCRVERIRPNLMKGEIPIASENCPNFYTLKISGKPEMAAGSADNGKSTSNPVGPELARMVREGKADSIPDLIGKMRPTTNASVYSFTASRVDSE